MIKPLFSFLGCLICVMLCHQVAAGMVQQDSLPSLSKILKSIKPPHFKKAVYNIDTYGAVADGRTDARPVIEKAIDLCSSAGGGEVLIPKGSYFVAGPVMLKSHVNLHFEDGAELVFSDDDQKYLPAVLTQWEGTQLYNYAPTQ